MSGACICMLHLQKQCSFPQRHMLSDIFLETWTSLPSYPFPTLSSSLIFLHLALAPLIQNAKAKKASTKFRDTEEEVVGIWLESEIHQQDRILRLNVTFEVSKSKDLEKPPNFIIYFSFSSIKWDYLSFYHTQLKSQDQLVQDLKLEPQITWQVSFSLIPYSSSLQ